MKVLDRIGGNLSVLCPTEGPCTKLKTSLINRIRSGVIDAIIGTPVV